MDLALFQPIFTVESVPISATIATENNQMDESCDVKTEANRSIDASDITENEQPSNEPSPDKKTTNRRSSRNIPPATPQSDDATDPSDEQAFVRRSSRNPDLYYLNRPDVKRLIDKIVSNHDDTVVLKIKEHGITDVNCVVMNEILKALWSNKVCQALYIQNVSKAFKNEQLTELIRLLKSKLNIWCLNLGENYEVSMDMWKTFSKSLPETNVTHLYISEHVIPIELKNEIRANIRENRKKHNKHCSMKNLSVIERCTHCWWNPINGVKELKPPVPVNVVPPKKPRTDPNILLKPEYTAFWAEGIGKGGDKPWKFRCLCGEVCSSYENYRYHPVGRMYECSRCEIWSHVDCVLGPQTTDEDLEEIVDLLCSHCNSKISRLKRYYGDDYQQYDDRSDIYQLSEKDLVRIREEKLLKQKQLKEKEEAAAAAAAAAEQKQQKSAASSQKSKKTTSSPSPKKGAAVVTPNKPNSSTKKKKPLRTPTTTTTTTTTTSTSSGNKGKKRKAKSQEAAEESDEEEDLDNAAGEWRFKCICGETCSWYENPLYRPKGRKFECTNCGLWSHVNCMFGERITNQEVQAMEVAHCYTCKSKLRRARRESRNEEPKVDSSAMEQGEGGVVTGEGGGGGGVVSEVVPPSTDFETHSK